MALMEPVQKGEAQALGARTPQARGTAWRSIPALPALLLLSACATTPPSDPQDICAIFQEKPDWHDAALEVQQKWGAPVHVPMAILYQESTFRHDAQPARAYVLGFIPWGRISSAYGYAQALDATWDAYEEDTGRWFAKRDDFSDALDFVGWYMNRSAALNGVSKWDARGQYLNYHEGWTGYRKRSYDSKSWLKSTAQKVQQRAERYGAQYRACSQDLGKRGLFGWF